MHREPDWAHNLSSDRSQREIVTQCIEWTVHDSTHLSGRGVSGTLSMPIRAGLVSPMSW